MDHYSLKQKSLTVQGYTLTIVMMPLIITIRSIIFIAYMTPATYYKNGFHFP